MQPIFTIPVEGPRIVPYGSLRLPSDVLPNGHLAFRVTQRFWDIDAYYNDGRIHGGLDLGNSTCGEKVLATAPGIVLAAGREPTSGALYVSIGHEQDYQSRYWHLDSIAVTQNQTVERGEVIGQHGSTGFIIGGCHLHFEIHRANVKLDPWPLLTQPDQVVLPDTSTPQEDILPKRLKVLNPPQMVSVQPAKALRAKEPKFKAAPILPDSEAMVGPYPFVGYTDEGDRYNLPDGASSKKWGAYKVNTNKSDPYAGYLVWFPAIYGTLTDVPH